LRTILEQSSGQTFPVIKEIIQTYAADPYHFVELQLLKLRGIADPLEIPNNLNFMYGLEISPILRFTLRYGMIAPLAVVGFLCSLKAWRKHVLIGLFGVVSLGSLMSSIILGRYRLILVPVLILYAAVGVTTFIDTFRRKQVARVMAVLALILGIAGIQNWLLPIPLLRKIPAFFVDDPLYSLSARIYASEGKFDQVLEELRRRKIHAMGNPDFQDNLRRIRLDEGDYRIIWAMQLLDNGKPEAAREQLALAEGAYADHFHLSNPNYNLGLLYLKFSEPTRAESSFERFLRIEPDGTRAESVRQILAGLKSPSESNAPPSSAE
jgi:hypothetical protein